MAQLFHPRADAFLKVIVVGGLGLIVLVLIGSVKLYNSDYYTGVGMPVIQPVPFSHQHHVGGLGIDCRYCHNTVEEADFAGMPATHTCMTCHSQIWVTSDMLKPVRASYETDRPMHWQRVTKLPDFVFFNHGIHVQNGVACETCHGRVDKMPLVWKVHNMTMGWCIDCHRDPAQYIRPRDAVFKMGWSPPENQHTLGARLMKEYDIPVGRLTDCSTCHR